jgi:acetyltransferase
MDFFFRPKGVAVIGATLDRFGGGRNLVQNLLLGYDGAIYPVNPKYKELFGLPCYPSILEVPDPLDLALVFIPARAVPAVLEQCVARGLPGAILECSGFAEIGPEGKALQDRCLAVARKGGLRLWGPNCMGLIDPARKYVFSFIQPESWEGALFPGGVSLIVQSGLLSGGFITTLMAERRLGLAKACSIGNKCDVEETELLEYFLKDPSTRVIAMYLESFPRGRRFFELARTAGKPIVVLKGGQSPSGAKASASHTGSLAGDFAVARGALEQAGVYLVEDFFELVDMARCLEKGFPTSKHQGSKPAVAVLTYSGAAGIVTADHLEKEGLALAELSFPTLERLQKISPPWMPIKNPVDFYPTMEQMGQRKAYRAAIAALHEDPAVEAVVVHMFPPAGSRTTKLAEMLAPVLEKGVKKPILFWVFGSGEGYEKTRLTLEELSFPVYYEIQRLVKVLARLLLTERREGGAPAPVKSRTVSLPTEILSKPEARGRVILNEQESKACLRAWGLPVVQEKAVTTLEAALQAAESLGYPVVLKGLQEGQVHKTEAGLVRLNLQNPSEVAQAFEETAAREGVDLFLIQPMLKGDLELIAGVIRDPQFGPAVMLGIGGVRAEIYKDVTFRLAPLTPTEVAAMVERLQGKALLKGFRGTQGVKPDLLARWLMTLGEWALMDETVQEIDVNPLLVVKGEPIAVDASIILER